jgi:nitrogen fixation protein FixH
MSNVHPLRELDTSPLPPTRRVSSAPRRTHRLWPWVPAILLVSLIGTQLTVLASVLGDPAFATEPDYYQKAVDWDAHRAREQESQALGWNARVRWDERDAANLRSLHLELTAADGSAVPGAQVHVVAFHNARAAQPLELEPLESSPGVYSATFEGHRPGLWELRIEATRGREAFETTLRHELPPEGLSR